MIDFVYVVTFEYDDEFEVVGAAGLYREAKYLIEKIIDNLPAKYNTEERKNKDNYYITGVPLYKDKLQQANEKRKENI